MTELSVSQKFISIGCNRTPNTSDCSLKSGRIAFGAHNTVALWDPTDARCTGTYATLKGHRDIVNAVRWVPERHEGEEVIVSGGVDCSVRIWKETKGEFASCQIINDHSGSANCIAVLHSLLATGSSDGSVKLYTFDSSSTQYTLQQSIQLSPLIPLTISLHSINDGFLLAIGGSSPHIQLYASSPETISFSKVETLKGHEDWIRSLDFKSSQSDIFLASASQDRYIRLWKITLSTTTHTTNDIDALLSVASGDESYPFTLNGHNYAVMFSALLPGHDDWVFTVRFHPTNPELLLSASADASLIIWRPEENSGIWIPETRLGEVSSLKGATTAQGSSGGFWGGVWSPNGSEVASWGKTGGWRVWCDQGDGMWSQKSAVGGSIRAVKGISWDPQGRYLLSVSLDQTTRMFGEWKRDGLVSWHELARPQIHGYDLNAVSSLNDWKFVSGADEKVVRVFQTSKATADLVNRLAGNLTDTEVHHLQHALMKNLPSTANLPVLGLSNKESSTTDEVVNTTLLHTLNTPPLEDHLSRYTLSPELEKLYAHPSEIIALSTSHSSKYIASTCKATTPENTIIRNFNTTNYAEIVLLKAHNLTVVKLAWSPNDKFLISVGRDRQWTLFETDNWTIVKSCPKAHARIIWDVSFAPLDFGSVFITGSRDKCIKVWSGEGWGCVATVKFVEAVTACEFLGEVVADKVFVAVGLENGAIYILGCDRGTESWKVIKKLDERITHSETVTGLTWRPACRKGVWELASSGDDCSVRIYQVSLETNGCTKTS